MECEDCEGCGVEKRACYNWGNQEGYCFGLDWELVHCFHFIVEEKSGEIVEF